MNNTTGYEVIDKLFSSYVVTCQKDKTRFYLTPERTASDILDRAMLFRWPDDAHKVAETQREEYAWRGSFDWDVESYASCTANSITSARRLTQTTNQDIA